jgi:lambda family phage portal protein
MADKKKHPLFERAIRAVAPRYAAARAVARIALAQADRVEMGAYTGTGYTGGYAGASLEERFTHWQPGNQDADSIILRDIRELRARSRDLSRSSGIAAGALETMATHVIGTGLSMQSRIDAKVLGLSDDEQSAWQQKAESLFEHWAGSTLSDVGDELTFYQSQDLMFRSRWESGDVFSLQTSSRPTPEWPFRLATQIIEADRVCNPNHKPDSDTLVQGIERDASGRRIKAHVASKHPGTRFAVKDLTWREIPFRGKTGRVNLIHLTRRLRPGQTRGVPELTPVIALIKQLTRYSDAEVDAAVNSAMFAMFAKMDPQAFLDVFDDDAQDAYMSNAKRWDGTLRSGSVMNLLPGEEITSAKTDRPNPNFDPFIQAMMRQIGVGLGIPYEVLSKAFNSSYSASRAALLDAWRTFYTRREWMASSYCQPVYEEFIADCVADGMLDAPGFFDDPIIRRAYCGATWKGDGPGSIDPSKEADAAGKRIEIGITTLAEEIIAYDGGDWETKHKQQVKEKEARDSDELNKKDPEPPAPPPPAPPPPAPEVNVTVSPATVNVGAPVVNVSPPEVNIEVQPSPPAQVTVEPPVVNVSPPTVNVSAPEVHVTTPPASVQVVSMHPKRATQSVERGANGEIKNTVVSYEKWENTP